MRKELSDFKFSAFKLSNITKMHFLFNVTLHDILIAFTQS